MRQVVERGWLREEGAFRVNIELVTQGVLQQATSIL